MGDRDAITDDLVCLQSLASPFPHVRLALPPTSSPYLYRIFPRGKEVQNYTDICHIYRKVKKEYKKNIKSYERALSLHVYTI